MQDAQAKPGDDSPSLYELVGRGFTPFSGEEVQQLRLYRDVVGEMNAWELAHREELTINVGGDPAKRGLAGVNRFGRTATSRGVADAAGEGGSVFVDVGECERCRELFGGELIVGRDPLPPGHPASTCIPRAA
jgi:hypothetical protein